VRVGYSRISSEQQSTTDPLITAERELRRAGAELVLVEVGSGRSDEQRPQFRRLREMVLDGKVSEVITPSQDRLGRNTELVLKFTQLCSMQGVQLLDLNGRELEVRTADGRLMTTIVAALDQHRSDLYSEKVRRAMKSAREQGLPARSHIPFGFRKIRNEVGRFIAIEIDPITGPLARKRIDWFLKDCLTMMALHRRITAEQPDHTMSHRQIARWLKSPMLTGRLAWAKDNTTKDCTQVATERSFPALISDDEHRSILIRLETASNAQGRSGRKQRVLSGITRCSECGQCLTYKYLRPDLQYLRCSTRDCKCNSKQIRVDQVLGCLQYALNLHALALVPLLNQQRTDPPEVFQLQSEIALLRKISGTEGLIEQKELEISRLQNIDTTAPARLIVGALRSQIFWLQEDPALNNVLHQILSRVEVELGSGIDEAKVTLVRCRTSPGEAPLPPDQLNIQIPVTADQLKLMLENQEQIQETLETLS